ncbi:MAG TPA: polysaccharide biosynthesis/export family protein [Candidatus Eisenbacteria bacterium]|jgi:polysaccharide export outer membrane protein
MRIALTCLCLLAAVHAAPARAAEEPDTTAMDWSLVPEYRIVPGDRLIFNLGPNPAGTGDILREMHVRPDGRVSVFPVGDVVAAGRTVHELEGALVNLLASVFKQPRVTIEVAEMAGNLVHVLGEVQSPGSFKAGPFMTVSQAVASAGGFKEDAARNSVLVYHRDGARTLTVTRVRLDRAIKRGTLEGDVALSRFDIVYVPRSTVGNIEVFTRLAFGGAANALNASVLGWELFNLERVFVVRTNK